MTGDAPVDPMTTLRGARVDVDVRRASRVAVAFCLVSLGALAIAFFVVGANKNAQINELRQHGVPVEVTVSRCLGLLAGSGSNDAGYACRGTYMVAGHRYDEAIPGDIFRAPGAKVRGVAARNDPQLLSTASDVESEHASWRVFILPTILLVALMLLLGVLALRSRSARAVPVHPLRAGR